MKSLMVMLLLIGLVCFAGEAECDEDEGYPNDRWGQPDDDLILPTTTQEAA